MIRVAIIGAGISGLSLAQLLSAKAKVTIFEKSRAPGGRMATRRAQSYAFDHGTQFFTVKTNEFKSFINPLLQAGCIEPWQAKFAEISKDKILRFTQWQADHHQHYVGVPGMNAVGKYLARGLEVKYSTKVETILTAKSWRLFDDEKQYLGEYDLVVFACPAMQAYSLAPDFFEFKANLAVKMLGCYALMLGFDNDLAFPFDAALVKESIISWISVNSSKPRRKNDTSILVTSTNMWADAHIDDDLDILMPQLLAAASTAVGLDLSIAKHKALHRWRFANISRQSNQVYFDKRNGLAAIGDWTIHGRVESAFHSALSLFKALSI